MTLLESMIALVIVGLFAVGVFDVLQASSASSRNTADWTAATAYADATIEAATLPRAIRGRMRLPHPAGFSAETERHPRSDGLEEIVVTVTMPGGSHFLLRRLATP